MRTLFTLTFFLLLFTPFALADDSKDNPFKDDDKIVIRGDINDDVRPRSLIFDPIEIYKNTQELKYHFYTNSSITVEVYNNDGNLVNARTVSSYEGQSVIVNISAWSAGDYNMVITNNSNGKTAYAEFTIVP